METNCAPPAVGQIGERVTLCPDGKYRWVYAVSLFKNPTFFWLIWKIFFFILLGIFVFITLLQTGNSWFGWAEVLDTAKFFGCMTVGMTALVGMGYLIYAAIMGGKYVIEFEMDEKGILHKQTASQTKKAQKLGRATMIAGAASGRIGAVGAGMSAQRTEMYSDFSRTRKVKTYRRRHLIKVSGVLSHNQVYAVNEDFDFVYDFIVTHCPRLKRK